MANITVVLFGLLVCVIKIVCDAQVITYINEDIVRYKGEMAQLSCCTNYRDIPVIWFKLNTTDIAESLILSVSGTSIIPTTRFTVQAYAGCYNLTINDIQEIDYGTYRCEVQIHLHRKLSADVKLNVLSSPVILSNSTKSSLFVTEGEYVGLECFAEGYPNPTISWKRTDNAILPAPHVKSTYRGNILPISQINRKDRGTYSCIANNGIGRDAQYNIAITVEYPPSITFSKPKLGQITESGQNITLECQVDAFPTPAIVWFKNGKQLYNNDHYSIWEQVITDKMTLKVLSISYRTNTTEHGYGNYFCRAINSLGTAESVIKLVPTYVYHTASMRSQR